MPAFTLQVVVVHEAFGDLLIVAKSPGSAKDGIDQGGLAVIDVGDDGQIANAVDWYHTANKPHLGRDWFRLSFKTSQLHH